MSDEGAWDYAEAIVRRFNNTLKPGELPSKVVDLYEDLDGADDVYVLHCWRKVNLFTLADHSGMYDKYRCERCGITGKRFGLSDVVRRDKKYAAKKYENCKE